MKKAILILCSISVLLSISSCSLDTAQENFQFTVLPVVSADFPEAFEHNGVYEIEVVLSRNSGCVFFENFDVSASALTTREISAIGTVFTDRPCTQAVEEITATFSFRVDYTEPYLFRFYTGMDESDNAIYLEYEVPVNQ
ncbi:hypothetical protein [uncultured Croceitalea sp.]|uniref:hypothetical protein n=1 Tax=uncultured Croceitalea sp. TaxID=1798908 RepID=UPI003306712E